MLAVSGGPDSRALLEAWATWPRRPAATVVGTVDHGVRAGAEAEAEAVVARATALGLRAEAVRVNPQGTDEAALRQARYDALVALARAEGVSAIVLAHHEGDVAEGLLMHLAGRGGGPGGMAPRPVTEFSDGVARVRPFLGLPRATLRAGLAALGVSDVVIDADDLAGKNARARLRRAVLEPLAEERPAIEFAMARHARLLREDDDALAALVPRAQVVPASLPAALLRRWLRTQIGALADDPRTGAAALDTALSLAVRGREGRVAVRGGDVVVRAGPGGLELEVVLSSDAPRQR